MKRTMKSASALFLALTMTISMIGITPIFAEDDTDSTELASQWQIASNYYAGSQVPADGGAVGTIDTATNTSSDDTVTVSKTISATNTENVFDIELKVQANIVDETVSEDAAVILVMDLSASMLDDVDGESVSDPFTNEDSRIYQAKEAAKGFIEAYAGSDTNATRQLAIVTFDSGAATKLGWTDVAGNPDNGTDAIDGITSIDSDAGTNLMAGLQQADTLLDASTISDIENVYVIVLTDGIAAKPFGGDGDLEDALKDGTLYYDDDDGYLCYDADLTDEIDGYAIQYCDSNNYVTTDEDDLTAKEVSFWLAKMAATELKAHATEPTLFTVCFAESSVKTENFTEDDHELSYMLKTHIASSTSNNYPAGTSAELVEKFAAIYAEIEAEANAWKVIDPMGTYITLNTTFADNDAVSVANNTIAWDLTEETLDSDGAYTLCYTITLDTTADGFVDGTYYLTNGTTKLSYDNAGSVATIYFNVPAVKGTAPSVVVVAPTPDEEVPLSDIPQTGDNRNLGFMVASALFSAAGLTWLIVEEKKLVK